MVSASSYFDLNGSHLDPPAALTSPVKSCREKHIGGPVIDAAPIIRPGRLLPKSYRGGGHNAMNPTRRIVAVLLALPLLVGCGHRSSDTERGAPSEMHIVIDVDGRLFVDGERVAVDYLGRMIERSLRDEKATFVISAAPGTSMGLLSDVNAQIPAKNMAGIHYPLPIE